MPIQLGPSLFEQTLATARFMDIEFPYVTPMRVEGGHTIVAHRAYRRRGADQEWTGQDPYGTPMRAALLNDLIDYPPQYPGTYSDLIAALEDNPIGQLWHPSKGLVTVAVKKWVEEWDADVQNGLFLDIHFEEHNATAATLNAPDGSNPATTSDTAAAQQAANADAAAVAMNSAAGVSGYVAMASLIDTMLGALALSNLSQAQVQGAIGPVIATIAANLALAGLDTPRASSVVQALETLRVTVYAIQSKLASPVVTQNYTVRYDAPLWQISQLATGDIGNASLIATFNVIPNPSLVRAGTVLRVPVV